MGSCAAPSAKGDDKFITTDYLQQCLYPGKVTDLNCFRIGNIGEVYIQDIEGLLAAIASYCENHLNQAVTA